jgi:hypothetical protein
MFSHRWLMCTPDSLAQVFSALERLPDGKGWIERNRAELAKVVMVLANQGSEQAATSNRAREQLTNVLERLGCGLRVGQVR